MSGNLSTNNRARKLATNTNSTHSLSHAASKTDVDPVSGQLGVVYTATPPAGLLYQDTDQAPSVPGAQTHAHKMNTEDPAPGWYCCRGQTGGTANHYAGPWLIALTEVCLTCNHARCPDCVVRMIGG